MVRSESIGLFVAGLAVILLLIGAFCPMTCAREGERSRRARCASNLHQIGMAMDVYRIDHTNIVSSFRCITNDANIPQLFVCPSSGHSPGEMTNLDQWNDYVMVTGATTAAPPDAIVVFCRPENHAGKGCNALCIDGYVHWLDVSELRKRLNRSNQAGPTNSGAYLENRP